MVSSSSIVICLDFEAYLFSALLETKDSLQREFLIFYSLVHAFLKSTVVRETKCTIAEVNAPVLMRWQFCRCFISFKEAQLLEFGMIFLGGFGIFYENSA